MIRYDAYVPVGNTTTHEEVAEVHRVAEERHKEAAGVATQADARNMMRKAWRNILLSTAGQRYFNQTYYALHCTMLISVAG